MACGAGGLGSTSLKTNDMLETWTRVLSMPPPPKKMEKRGALRGSLLKVACSGFYVHLKSVFPLIRF